jgi:DNA-directed RNA polymerase subunit K/omega
MKDKIVDMDPKSRDCNRFMLSVAVAKRARQLREDEDPFVADENKAQEEELIEKKEVVQNIEKEEVIPVIKALEEIGNKTVSVILKAAETEDEEYEKEIEHFLKGEKKESKAAEKEEKKTKDGKLERKSLKNVD